MATDQMRETYRSLGWKFQPNKKYRAVLKMEGETVILTVEHSTHQDGRDFYHVECYHPKFGFVDSTKRPTTAETVPSTVRHFLDKCSGPTPDIADIQWKECK